MNVVKSSKKYLAVLLIMVMLLSMIPMMAMADEHEMTGVAFRIDVMGYWVDGEWMEADVAPYIQDSRTMVPVAHAARAIDAEVAWDAENQVVTVTKGEATVLMTIGNNVMIMDDEVIVMDTVPVIKDLGNGLGRTMLPVSWLAKALDVSYTWEAETKTATFMPEVEEVVEPMVFDEAGTFGPASETVTIDNDVIIMAEDVVLQNYVITGDLIIAEEVGEGDVTLNNVTVEGELIVRGGGEDSIYINGGSIKTVRIEATSSGAVRIVAIDAEGMEVIVAEQAADQKIVLEGNFDKVTIEAKDVDVETRGETTIKEMLVAEQSEGVTVTLSAETTVEKAVVDSDSVAIEGEGTVEAKDGEGDVTYGDNVTEPVTRPSFGGGGGGGGGTTYTKPQVTSVDYDGVEYEANTDNEFIIAVDPNELYDLGSLSITFDRAAKVEISSATKGPVNVTFEDGATIVIPTSIGSYVTGGDVTGQILIDESPIQIRLMNVNSNSTFTDYVVIFEEASI